MPCFKTGLEDLQNIMLIQEWFQLSIDNFFKDFWNKRQFGDRLALAAATLIIKKCRKLLDISGDSSVHTDWGGSRRYSMVSNNTCGLWQFDSIIFDRCSLLASLTMLWYQPQQSFRIWWETCSLPFFHLCSAVWHSCLSVRVLILNQG